jgi:serine protease Do
VQARFRRLAAAALFLPAVLFCSKPDPAAGTAAARPAQDTTPRPSGGIAESRQNAITRAVSQTSPAIVGINVVQIYRVVQRTPFDDDPFWKMYFPQREYTQKVKGLGSGFLISSDGYVLTNEHVVHEAAEIVVTTTDGKQYTAELVGSDFLSDIALLKILGKRFPFIPLGDSDDILIGEWAIALGNPFGLFDVNSKPTVTVGVISAAGMNFQGELKVEGRSYENMIQTDAAINGGNSGGPLVNGLGECIGVNTFIISGSDNQKTSIGIGFAIPINRVKKLLPELKAFGRIRRPSWTGLDVRDLRPSEIRRLRVSPQGGVLIENVRTGSPGDDVGLRRGDVIVSVGGEPVRSSQEFQRHNELFDPDNAEGVTIEVYRDGRLLEGRLVPGA